MRPPQKQQSALVPYSMAHPISDTIRFDKNIENIEKTIVQRNKTLETSSICYGFVPIRTTMTVLLIGNTGIGDHRLNSFKEWYIQQIDPRGDCYSLTSHRKFHNCVILKRTVQHRNKGIAIKVFSNGKLHLTGITTIEQAVTYGQEVMDTIQDFTGEEVYLKSFTPQLINYRAKLNVPDGMVLCLKSMADFWRQDTNVSVLLNSEHYPGVRIKLNHNNHISTVLIFESGSVLLNAVISADELEFVYRYIADSIHEMKCILKPMLKKQARDKAFCYSAFVV